MFIETETDFCKACDKETPKGTYWCSTFCFYEEDGYPDDGDIDD